MATMTLTIGASTKSWTISAGDVTRVLDAYRKTFGKVPSGDSPAGLRDMTNAEVFDRVAQQLERGIKNVVRNVEGKVVSDAVADITLT